MEIRVVITSVSGERLIGPEERLPPRIHINTNLNILAIRERSETAIDIPFIAQFVYVPSVAQISIKGIILVRGSKEELDKIRRAHQERKPVPPPILHAATTTSIVEAVLIARELAVPPPIATPPPVGVQQPQRGTASYTI
ncbi:hypothetical protein DRN94_003765 [archaeon]|nr:hypothetical protein [archaeon]